MERQQNMVGRRGGVKVNLSKTIDSTRTNLQKRLNEGKIVETDNLNWQIPGGKLAGPNSVFDETDEAFRSIITQNRDKIMELNEIDDIDEFCRQSFEFIKIQMGIGNFSLKLIITDDDNCYDYNDNSIHISRNRAGPKKKHILGGGDKAEIFAGIVHEMVHRLEHKEILLNSGKENEKVAIRGLEEETWDGLFGKWIESTTLENVNDILNKSDYKANQSGTEEFLKAQEFAANWLNYISPFDESGEREGQIKTGIEYEEYRRQPVEARAFRVGEMMANEYRKAVSKGEK